jgi:putative membrane protein
MRWVHTAVIIVLAVAFLIFALQNLQSVTVAFLGFGITAPLAVLFLVIYLLGMATGGSARALIRWAWQGSRQPEVAQK